MVGPCLRRLELAASCSACELTERGTAFLWQLRGLTSLDLENCLGGCCCASVALGLPELHCSGDLDWWVGGCILLLV